MTLHAGTGQRLRTDVVYFRTIGSQLRVTGSTVLLSLQDQPMNPFKVPVSRASLRKVSTQVVAADAAGALGVLACGERPALQFGEDRASGNSACHDARAQKRSLNRRLAIDPRQTR